MAAEEAGAGAEAAVALTAYGRPLTAVLSFKYLGRVLSSSDDDWEEVIQKLQIERQKWVRLLRVIGQEGETHGCQGCYISW